LEIPSRIHADFGIGKEQKEGNQLLSKEVWWSRVHFMNRLPAAIVRDGNFVAVLSEVTMLMP
jgi:hypothetical protein